MKIYILRHAIAEEYGPTWEGRDDERPLSAEGASKFRQAAGGLRALELAPTHLLTSPLLRARQTADLLVERLKQRELEVRVSVALRPDRPARLPEEMLELPTDARVFLVGHNPHLTRLASYLLTGHEELRIDLKKGGLIQLSIQDPGVEGTAVLEAVLTQKQLRGLR